METIPIFDWLRWVEVPVWIALGSMFFTHVRYDHKREVDNAREFGKIEGLENALGLVLDKLIPERIKSDE